MSGSNATFRTFRFKTMTTATSTAFLQEGENNEDAEMDRDTKKGHLKRNFFSFLDCFGSSVCGYSRFNESRKGQQMFSNACTVSDEAFAILLLRKNWKTWEKRAMDLASQENRTVLVEMTEAAINAEDETENVLPVYASNKTNKKFQGWHFSAISEYNDHFNNVRAARATETRKEFEKEFQHIKSSAYTCSWREPTIPSLSNTNTVYDSAVPCNELNVVSDWSSRSNDAFSDVSMTQDSHDTTDTPTSTAAV
jgi:hypothetical protein